MEQGAEDAPAQHQDGDFSRSRLGKANGGMGWQDCTVSRRIFLLLDGLGGGLLIPMGEIELLYGNRQILRLQRGN